MPLPLLNNPHAMQHRPLHRQIGDSAEFAYVNFTSLPLPDNSCAMQHRFMHIQTKDGVVHGMVVAPQATTRKLLLAYWLEDTSERHHRIRQLGTSKS